MEANFHLLKRILTEKKRTLQINAGRGYFSSKVAHA